MDIRWLPLLILFQLQWKRNEASACKNLSRVYGDSLQRHLGAGRKRQVNDERL